MGWKFLYNIYGAQPTRKRIARVAAGSTETMEKGDMIGYVTGDSRCEKVDAAADYDQPLSICDEDQDTADVARHLMVIVPKWGDVFEVDLDSADAPKFGEKIEIVDHESVQVCSGGKTYIGYSMGDDNYHRDSTTVSNKNKVQVMLTEQLGKEFAP